MIEFKLIKNILKNGIKKGIFHISIYLNKT